MQLRDSKTQRTLLQQVIQKRYHYVWFLAYRSSETKTADNVWIVSNNLGVHTELIGPLSDLQNLAIGQRFDVLLKVFNLMFQHPIILDKIPYEVVAL